jgi:hypothetical protein
MPLRLLANRGQAREGKRAMSGIQWPGRQEWAERRRDPNWFDHIEVSNRLADYATQAEMNDTMAAIKDLWRALGRQMGSASDIEALQFRCRRAGVNRAFKAMREGEIPGAPLECRYGVPPALLAPFDARRKAALEAAVQRAIKAMPIDDAAWATELEWRRRVDARNNG